MRTITGLQRLTEENKLLDHFEGNIALLCHSASITHDYAFAPDIFKELFQDRFCKLFGPQHGFVTDVQDNMIETDDYIHPFYQIPVHSLYGNVRWPTKDMLKDIDTFVVDLQDVGTRVYTYIWTLAYVLEKCEEQDIKVIVLDRPNPIDGETLEGTILNKEFASFVGRDELLHRHGLTIGEFAKWYKGHNQLKTRLEIIEMKNWKREFSFLETNLPWINPSPNLPVADACFSFVSTVMLEGTNLSEGRGTTRPLEFIGHPKVEPYQFLEILKKHPEFEMATKGICFRPTITFPMFQKHAERPNGGLFFHTIDRKNANFWKCGQFLIREFRNYLQDDFQWKTDAYEYEHDKKAIDLINGDQETSKWIENNSKLDELTARENTHIEDWQKKREEFLIYH